MFEGYGDGDIAPFCAGEPVPGGKGEFEAGRNGGAAPGRNGGRNPGGNLHHQLARLAQVERILRRKAGWRSARW